MSLDLVPQPTRQAVAARERTQPGKVTGKLRRALDAMVWQGLARPAAAQAAGLTDHGLREALRRPHVRQAYIAECEVLRLSGRARGIHRMHELLEQDDNKMASVAAFKALNASDDAETQQRRGVMSSPGLIIQIVQAPSHTANVRSIDANPLIEQGSDSLTSSVQSIDSPTEADPRGENGD